ncbi:GNAT family N-acetyltransferase [Blastococcus sp. SYSU D01042]
MIRIRRAGQADIPTAVAFQQEWLPEAQLNAQLRAPSIYPLREDHVLLLAQERDLPVGMLFGTAPRAIEGMAGHLLVLAVSSRYRRQGLGRRLIREFALIAEAHGTDVVWVDPIEGPDERVLLSYYAKLGWTDRTGMLEGRTDHRREQMHGTVATILAAVGREA